MRSGKTLLVFALVIILAILVPQQAQGSLVLDKLVGATHPAGPLNGGIAYVKITDNSAAFSALLSKQIDEMWLTEADQIQQAKSAGFTITTVDERGWDAIWFNFQSNITRALAIRQAMCHLLPKDDLISSIWGPLASYAVSVLGSGYGKYANTEIDDYTTYDPAFAAHLLDQAGYTLNTQTNVRKDPATGQDLLPLQFVYPSDLPHYNTIAERYANELTAAGIPVAKSPAPFNTGEFANRVIVGGDYEMCIIGILWQAAPEVLNIIWNSKSPPTFLNFQRYNNPAYDAQMQIYETSLNESAVVAAAQAAQQILADDAAICTIDYQVRNYAFSPDWTGMVQGQFSDTSTTQLLRIRPKNGDYSKVFRFRQQDEAENLVFGYDMHAVSDQYCRTICGLSFFDDHPANGPYEPWLAKDWKIESWSNPAIGVNSGTKLTINFLDGVKWHDGVSFTADDYAFACMYTKNKAVPRAGSLDNGLVSANTTSSTQCVVYYNRTGLFILDDQLWALCFPKHIFNDNTTLYGSPAGLPAGTYSGQVGYGVQDPSTFTGYKVTNPFNSSLTCLIGVGPYMYTPGGWQPGVALTLTPNRQYFKNVLLTDINFDFKVDMKDIGFAARAFGKRLGMTGYNPTADIDGNDAIDMKDIGAIAKDYGKIW